MVPQHTANDLLVHTETAEQSVSAPLAVAAALLSLAVAAVHIIDQGGFPGSKDPGYLGIGYYLLELAGLVVSVALLTRRGRNSIFTWVLASGIALGPIVGYCLSRGPGLPAYTDDMGNWAEPLGLISLAVEATLLVLGLAGGRLAARRTRR